MMRVKILVEKIVNNPCPKIELQRLEQMDFIKTTPKECEQEELDNAKEKTMIRRTQRVTANITRQKLEQMIRDQEESGERYRTKVTPTQRVNQAKTEDARPKLAKTKTEHTNIKPKHTKPITIRFANSKEKQGELIQENSKQVSQKITQLVNEQDQESLKDTCKKSNEEDFAGVCEIMDKNTKNISPSSPSSPSESPYYYPPGWPAHATPERTFELLACNEDEQIMFPQQQFVQNSNQTLQQNVEQQQTYPQNSNVQTQQQQQLAQFELHQIPQHVQQQQHPLQTNVQPKYQQSVQHIQQQHPPQQQQHLREHNFHLQQQQEYQKHQFPQQVTLQPQQHHLQQHPQQTVSFSQQHNHCQQQIDLQQHQQNQQQYLQQQEVEAPWYTHQTTQKQLEQQQANTLIELQSRMLLLETAVNQLQQQVKAQHSQLHQQIAKFEKVKTIFLAGISDDHDKFISKNYFTSY